MRAKQRRATPAALDSDMLVRTLAGRRHLVSFFNDVKITDPDPAVPAAQYFGTKGFFADYDARLNEPLTEVVGKVWSDEFTRLNTGVILDGIAGHSKQGVPCCPMRRCSGFDRFREVLE